MRTRDRKMLAATLILGATLLGNTMSIAFASEPSAARNSPAATPPAKIVADNAVAAIESVDDEDDESTPQSPDELAAQDAHREYMAALYRHLRASTSPRDRALAAMLPIDDEDIAARIPLVAGEREALLDAAALAAPDDALVQWIAVNADLRASTGSTAEPGAAHYKAFQAVQSANAVAWLVELPHAISIDDQSRIDELLDRAAAATHADGFFLQIAEAWIAVYERMPIPTAAWRADATFSAADAPVVMAVAMAAAFAMPHYASISSLCDPAKSVEIDARRADACDRITRLLAAEPLMLDRMIGQMMLRKFGRATEADLAAEREMQWLREQTGALWVSHREDGTRFFADWRETRDEIEAIRRQLHRAGIAVTPPPDWKPARH